MTQRPEMKLSQIKGEQRNSYIAYVENRWTQLQGRIVERSEAAWKYLMLTNAGSALAVLSFMGAYKTIEPIPNAPSMLIAFLSGVVLVGVGHAIAYYRATWLFSGWRADISRFYTDDIGWSEVLTRDNTRSGYFIWVDVVAWLSFICFFAGLGLGVYDVTTVRKAAMNNQQQKGATTPSPLTDRSDHPRVPPPPPPEPRQQPPKNK